MNKNTLTIGTRGSKLALIYAEKVKNELNKFFPNEIKLKKILTRGDQKQDQRLSDIGGKGLFAEQIEKELLNEDIDIFRSNYGLLKLSNTTSRYFLIKCYFNILFVSINILFSALKLFIKRKVLKKLSKRKYYNLYNHWLYSLNSFNSIISNSSKILFKRIFNKQKLSKTKINFEKLIH